jgi:prepilin signal peptidase PulO-like enzyme (type II secretory pathway)
VEKIILLLFSFLFGLCIGSFLNAVIYRLPRKISLSKSRSHCPGCNKLIFWYENIPLLSYLFLRGKCSKCDFKIPFQYPLIELIVGIFALFITPNSLELNNLWSYFFYVSIFSSFLSIVLIDLRHKLIPNSINIYLSLMFFSAVVYTKGPFYWATGAAIGVLFPLGVTYGFYLIKGQVGLGGGDIKLFGALGLYLGPIGIIHNIFLSCFVGAIIGASLILLKVVDRKTPIPFGPFIILVASVQIFLPEYFARFMGLILGHP